MKTITQLVILLILAGIITGAAFALEGSSAAASDNSGQPARFEEEPRLERFGSTEGRPDVDREGGQPAGLAAAAGFLKTLVPFTLIIALVTGLSNLFKKLEQRPRPMA